MTHRPLRVLLTAIALLTMLSCAGGGYAPQTPSMPAARAALRPEYRVFYDALVDDGDWVLIEPYGFVFHPRVDFATFRPYAEGFWAPSDAWGWIWISAEPFGWATYHYGSWAYDRFQGWVWIPGVNWAPAWVDWQVAGNYAGWAPRGPGGLAPNLGAPGGPYVYAPLTSMGATDLKMHIATGEELGAEVASAQRVTEMVEKDGVRVQFGPSFKKVEQARGISLNRVALERTPSSGEAKTPAPAGIEAVRREGAQIAESAHVLTEQHGESAPSIVHVVRPAWIGAPASEGFHKPKAHPAHADTARADSTR